MNSLGIIGVGNLTEKMVRGLRCSGFTGDILLSPRSSEMSRALAQECGCQVMATNQAVADHAELVCLGVRSTSLNEVAAEINLKPGQGLVSLATGVGLQQLAKVFPGARCMRALFSYTAQFNRSTVVIYPPDAQSQELLKPLGNMVILEDEAAFELATVAACMNGWFYFLLHDLQQWLVDKGLPAAEARALVLSNLQDCIDVAKQQPEHTLKALGQAIATPGTFTADGLAVLMHQPASATWGAACEVVLDALLTRAELS
ncbi:pyrroline-5-carboxylate reductase [Pseudomonas luteola]|uniref:NAD(P)-binding domain-containing protein n=1 Tax=Pseudomonas luteola TaxID=47886 RepID=UPI000F7AEC9F|nr:NAD(P)-binding domain-containing protein [Pseudomonas luteola]RRW40650.1 pyrroline-5-carboxylate reductase [Pseudomonas luteola]